MSKAAASPIRARAAAAHRPARMTATAARATVAAWLRARRTAVGRAHAKSGGYARCRPTAARPEMTGDMDARGPTRGYHYRVKRPVGVVILSVAMLSCQPQASAPGLTKVS